MKVQFNVLAYGARFRYINDPDNPDKPANVSKTWVKIGPNEIAEWEDHNAATNWVGQQICSFAYNDNALNEEVEFLL
jgi:hypothetical protein